MKILPDSTRLLVDTFRVDAYVFSVEYEGSDQDANGLYADCEGVALLLEAAAAKLRKLRAVKVNKLKVIRRETPDGRLRLALYTIRDD